MTLKLTCQDNEVTLRCEDHVLFRLNRQVPVIYLGKGEEQVEMYRGNYKIEDYVTERIPLLPTEIRKTEAGALCSFGQQLGLECSLEDGIFRMKFFPGDTGCNRFWIRFASDASEKFYGCGEQMSYFNMKGRHFPIWTSEPGVGRDKSTYVTWRSDVENKAGGDYYNTNFPEPTFVSSRKYYLHADSTAYADFDFRRPVYSELQFWNIPDSIRIEAADSFPELLEKLTGFLGRQPLLPDWVDNGLILGVQGGQRSFDLLQKCLDAGVDISALWCQDWCGKRVTSFGKRLQWDWHFHEEMYPGLPEKIAELHRKGIRFMGYVNPYLVNDGLLYQEGLEKGYFAKKSDGSEYLVDFGEFYCGVVDLTNPDAFAWFKDQVMKKYMLGIGMDGWMADFGEYLPTDDILLYSGKPAMIEHNHWPALWAKCNYDLLAENGKLGQVVYFMRAGGTGSQKYCTLLWAGDQSVDFSRHDGIGTVICAALSAGMSGCGLNHSDIGGYTSLFGNCRTKELFLRWTEMAAFTPVMRTHEGNRPDENFQFYNDGEAIAVTARMTHIFRALTPYRKAAVEENSRKGTPVQRPLFFYYEEEEAYTQQFEYLLGRDLLVAPVVTEGAVTREVYLPEDQWINLWTGERAEGGHITVEAPIGKIPVFYREESKWCGLFETIREL